MWKAFLGRPASHHAVGPGAPQRCRRIVVLEEGATPSGAYILHPWLARQGPAVHRVDARTPPRVGDLAADDFVVVLRYLHPPWKAMIERCRGVLAGLAWFMDDDLLDRQALRSLSPGYAKKIRTLALAHRPWFQRMGGEWWVSTAALAGKYAELAPCVLPLDPPPALLTARPAVKIVYHGTASHGGEFDWLQALVGKVQAQRSDTHFEFFGDLSVNRRYRDFPRVAVLHPMSWSNYLAYTASHTAQLGLAPLLPGPFNEARGPVKFLDYTRMGALGLYSNVAPYAGYVRDGVDGVLLETDVERWVAAICRWADDAAAREALVEAAHRRLAAPEAMPGASRVLGRPEADDA